MNKITDEEIYNYMTEQLEKVEEIYNKDRIFGIFTYGKVNYGFAETIDDVQLLLYYLPTFEELCIPSTEKVIYAEIPGTKVLRTDLRAVYNLIITQDMSTVETFFVSYKIINPKYEYLYDKYFYKHKTLFDYYNCKLRCQNAINRSFIKLDENELKGYSPEATFEAYRLKIHLEIFLNEGNVDESFRITNESYSYFLWQILEHKVVPNMEQLRAELMELNTRIRELPNNQNKEAGDKILKDCLQEVMKVALSYDTSDIEKFSEELTATEYRALQLLVKDFDTNEKDVSISQLIDKTNISRPVYTSLFYKLKESKIAEIDNRGVKGTHINFNNMNEIRKLFDNK
jgi:hypothetical protein